MVLTWMSTLSLYSLSTSVTFLSVISTASSIEGDSQFLALCFSLPLCPNLIFSTNLPIILNSIHPEWAHHSPQHTSFFLQFSSFWCHALRKLEQKPQSVITFTPGSKLLLPKPGAGPCHLEPLLLQSPVDSVLSLSILPFSHIVWFLMSHLGYSFDHVTHSLAQKTFKVFP